MSELLSTSARKRSSLARSASCASRRSSGALVGEPRAASTWPAISATIVDSALARSAQVLQFPPLGHDVLLALAGERAPEEHLFAWIGRWAGRERAGSLPRGWPPTPGSFHGY